MAMTINTNIVSINAQRNLSLSGNSLSTSMQRLSSGLRVNSAKDDAAGLAISERMRSQSAGLSVAARNANDGISLAQTTEGALGKVGDMLQRMRELAVQSSNATNSTADREALQSEVTQLRSEIDRVAKTTQFNGQKVLDGTFSGGVFQVGANAGDNITIKGTTKATADGLGNVSFGSTTSKTLTADNITDIDKALSGLSVTVGGKTTNLTDLAKASSGQERLGQMVSAINEKTADTGVTAFLQEGSTSGQYTISLKSESAGAVTLQGFDSLNAAAGQAAEVVTGTSSLDFDDTNDAVSVITALPDGDNPTAVQAKEVIDALTAQLANAEGYDNAATGAVHTGAAADIAQSIGELSALMNSAQDGFATNPADAAAQFKAAVSNLDATVTADWTATDTENVVASLAEKLNAASSAALSLNKDSTVDEITEAVTAVNTARTDAGLGNLTSTAPAAGADAAAIEQAVKSLQAELDPLGLAVAGTEITEHKGISSIDIGTQAGAWEAIKQIDSAINQVNAARGDLGALQTRFEKSIENIDIQNENISAARGRIVDADFASETANLSRAQILQQAGTAMVAQANQLPQSVLSLLQ